MIPSSVIYLLMLSTCLCSSLPRLEGLMQHLDEHLGTNFPKAINKIIQFLPSGINPMYLESGAQQSLRPLLLASFKPRAQMLIQNYDAQVENLPKESNERKEISREFSLKLTADWLEHSKKFIEKWTKAQFESDTPLMKRSINQQLQKRKTKSFLRVMEVVGVVSITVIYLVAAAGGPLVLSYVITAVFM